MSSEKIINNAPNLPLPAKAIRKYQVFVSSTFRDLQEERRQISWEILKIGFIPVGMENFSAMDERGWETIASAIEQSDYYVLIIGALYGSKDAYGKSWTQREYEHARQQGVPILAFIRELNAVPGDMVERGPDKEPLDSFIQMVRAERLIEEWTTIDDLRARVHVALMMQVRRDGERDHSRPGWYRGPVAPSVEEIVTLSAENRRLRGRIAARDAGTFPTFVPDIIDAIKLAPPGTTIRIACDYAAYGMFSVGAMFDKYFAALEDAVKARKCVVDAIILGSYAHERQIAQVSKKDQDFFTRLEMTTEYQALLNAFGDRMASLQFPKPNKWTREDLLRGLASVGAHYEGLMRNFVNIQITPQAFPLYLWITKSKAIWSISPLEPAERLPTLYDDLTMTDQAGKENLWDEHEYITDDHGPVHRLTQVWAHYQKVCSGAAAAITA